MPKSLSGNRRTGGAGIGVFTVDGKMVDIAFYDGAVRTRTWPAAGVRIKRPYCLRERV